MFEAVALAVGRERFVVEGEGRARAVDDRVSRVEAHADAAGHARRERAVERVECGPQRRGPQSVVDELRVLLVERALEPEFVAREDETFERLVRGDQRDRARALVDFARLHADHAIFDHVDPADPVRARAGVEPRDEPGTAPSVDDRLARFEIDNDGFRFVRSRVRCRGPRVGVFGRRVPRIFQDARFDRAAPQIRIHGIRFRGRVRDGDAVRSRVDHRVRTRERFVAQRRERGDRRVERARGELDADLVVALARAPVRDRIGTVALRGLDQ